MDERLQGIPNFRCSNCFYWYDTKGEITHESGHGRCIRYPKETKKYCQEVCGEHPGVKTMKIETKY